MKTYLGTNYTALGKWLLLAAAILIGLHAGPVLADGGSSTGIGKVAENINSGMKSLVTLITSVSFVMGFGFAAAAILKFKAHKDNPAQIPIGTPIALLFIAAALIYLPQLYKTAGSTIFGTGAKAGTTEGIKVEDLGT